MFFRCIFLSLLACSGAAAVPEATLPSGYQLTTAAASPVVHHPMMAAIGEPGVLYVGDAAGVNLDRAGLEKDLPNRVLRLRDTQGNGVYDQVTVFADKMTFPQGAVWLNGSLYVASPPGIWKLTDTHGDGMADRRELIVSGFDFTGNAADIHGPFLHPNGRLYWCHGRKGHEVKQRDGAVVHAGLASGIWSCRPDGSDVQWHALAGADNPVEIDFTPEGEILGTINLYYSNPRGDVIMHWLHGGVYPREDQLKAVEGLPRTLETMPVVHNFGHVAVSGCTFYRSGALNPAWRGDLFVTHFNSQRVTRMEMTRQGATYRAIPREFLHLGQPDAHLTDVLEDRDGSLLVVDTGGWFRIGCPSSLMAKPEVEGAIYRIRPTGASASVEPWGATTAPVWKTAREGGPEASTDLAGMLRAGDASVAQAAANALASNGAREQEAALRSALARPEAGVRLAAANAMGCIPGLSEETVQALLASLAGDLEPALEHQAMAALFHAVQPETMLAALHDGLQPARQRRVLTVLSQCPNSPLRAGDVLALLSAPDEELAKTAARIVSAHPAWLPGAAAILKSWLAAPELSELRLALSEQIAAAGLSEPALRELVTGLLQSPEMGRRRAACRILAQSNAAETERAWDAPLSQLLQEGAPADAALALDVMARLRTTAGKAELQHFAADAHHALVLRLKAFRGAWHGGAVLPPESFDFLRQALADPLSPAARLEAARMLGASKLTRDQLLALAPALPPLGPLELRPLTRPYYGTKDAEVASVFAAAFAGATALSSFQESEIRTIMSNLPEEAREVIQPALAQLSAEDEARRHKLETWPARIAAEGCAAEGKKLFETGHGSCVGCHRIGDVGNFVGPNLSTIGQIRTERDLLESVLYPSATIARGYEAQTIETADGQTVTAVIHRNLPDALVIADISGQERTVPRAQITSIEPVAGSLMPMGLERTMPEAELIDILAFLRSRR